MVTFKFSINSQILITGEDEFNDMDDMEEGSLPPDEDFDESDLPPDEEDEVPLPGTDNYFHAVR